MRLLLLCLAACGAVPTAPSEPRFANQAQYAVGIVMSCQDDDLGNFLDDYDHPGTGVIVDRRHVLTAAHVVECPVIPIARVTLADGRETRMLVERDDREFGAGLDIARLVNLADEDLGDYVPPVLGEPSGRLCAATLSGRACGEMATAGDYFVFGAVTKAGDSGSGVYDDGGRLVGLVTAGSGRYTKAVKLTKEWVP